ncbi:MAG: ion transporter [Acidobacteriota bacterium]
MTDWRARLSRVVNHVDTPAGRAVSLVIQALIVLSLVTFSIETLPDLSPETRAWLHWIEVVTVALFTIEYLLRWFAAERRWAFVFSFFGIVDLLAILPFYLASGLDLRSLRALRLLRLVRILKLARYARAMNRIGAAFRAIREELVLFGTASLIVLYLSAVGIYHFEHEAQPEQFGSVFASLWWAMATLTTVGYGDVYPVTAGGRTFTFFVLAIGLGIIAVPTGLMASALSRTRETE